METITKNELIKNTLQDLTLIHLGEDATEFLSLPDELADYDVNQIYDELQDNGFFNVEIIYYHKAMEYLKEHDTSLNESLELAAEMGFNLSYINSECLASLHASQQRMNKFWEDVEPKLDKIINNLKN